jgi:hypothetical protein
VVLEDTGADHRAVPREQPREVLGGLAGVDPDLGVAQRDGVAAELDISIEVRVLAEGFSKSRTAP